MEKVQHMDKLYKQGAMKEVSHKSLHIVYDSENSNQTEPQEAYWLTGSGLASGCK